MADAFFHTNLMTNEDDYFNSGIVDIDVRAGDCGHKRRFIKSS